MFQNTFFLEFLKTFSYFIHLHLISECFCYECWSLPEWLNIEIFGPSYVWLNNHPFSSLASHTISCTTGVCESHCLQPGSSDLTVTSIFTMCFILERIAMGEICVGSSFTVLHDVVVNIFYGIFVILSKGQTIRSTKNACDRKVAAFYLFCSESFSLSFKSKGVEMPYCNIP